MGYHCVALNCTLKQCKELTASGITFHTFPKNQENRKKWLAALRRPDLTPRRSFAVCSRHFEDSCFYTVQSSILSQSRILKPRSIPTLFDFNQHDINVSPISPRNLSPYVNGVIPFNFNVLPSPRNLPPYFNGVIPFMMQNHTSNLQNIANFFGTPPYYDATNQPMDLTLKSSPPQEREQVVPTAQLTMSTNDVTSLANTPRVEYSIGNLYSCSNSFFDDQDTNLILHLNKTQHLSNNKRKTYIGDFDEEDMMQEQKAKRFFRATQKNLYQKDLKINALQQQVKRIQNRKDNETIVKNDDVSENP